MLIVVTITQRSRDAVDLYLCLQQGAIFITIHRKGFKSRPGLGILEEDIRIIAPGFPQSL